MRKKLLGILLVLQITCISGCGNASEKESLQVNQESAIKETVETLQTTETTQENETQVYDEEFKPNEYEKVLGITKEIKAKFLEKYDEKTYQNAVLYNYYILYMKSANRVEEFDADAFGSVMMVETEVSSSRDAHVIPADYLKHDEETNQDLILMLPGIGCNRRTAKGAIGAFLELGYDVWAMDLPGFGENGAELSTYGLLEQYDVEDTIRYIREALNITNRIYLYGYSYGAGVSAVSLSNEYVSKEISGVILDSPFSSMEELVRLNVGGYIFNGSESEETVLGYVNYLEELIFGVDMSKSDGVEVMKQVEIPVLIFTSEADKVIPSEAAKSLYDAAKSEKKKLVVFDDAKHTDAVNSNHEEYVSELKSFLDTMCQN